MITRAQAEQRVNRGFGIHLGVYVIVISALATLNFNRSPDHLWFMWVAVWWGLGLLFHGANAFLIPHERERKIARVIARVERKHAAQVARQARHSH